MGGSHRLVYPAADLLTVREHLELFAKIKGVSADRVERVVADKLTEMDLGDFENKKAGSLSGGNKRKLSVAIAMMGNPPLMFLDEVCGRCVHWLLLAWFCVACVTACVCVNACLRLAAKHRHGPCGSSIHVESHCRNGEDLVHCACVAQYGGV